MTTTIANKEPRELVYIACPIGCRLTLTPEGDGITVSGNKCKRGEVYANEEWFAPRRMVTTTCTVSGGSFFSRVPVRTTRALPVEHIQDLLQRLHSARLTAPLPMGSIVEKDVGGTGVDVITSHSV